MADENEYYDQEGSENQGSENEEVSMEELVEGNNYVLNSLVDLLVEKNIISEDELQKKLEQAPRSGDSEESNDE